MDREDGQATAPRWQTSSKSREILTFLLFGPKTLFWNISCLTAKDTHIWIPVGLEREHHHFTIKEEAGCCYFTQKGHEVISKEMKTSVYLGSCQYQLNTYIIRDRKLDLLGKAGQRGGNLRSCVDTQCTDGAYAHSDPCECWG